MPHLKVLERFCPPGLVRSVSKRINQHLYNGGPLFRTEYTNEQYQFQSTKVVLDSSYYSVTGGSRRYQCHDIQLTAPYSRVFINKIRNFVKFLEALVRYSIDVLKTKQTLLEHLDPLDTDTVVNESLEKRLLKETYIGDVQIAKLFIVNLATYHQLIDSQGHFLIESQLEWDSILSSRFERGIVDIIESFLVYEPTTPVNNTFLFQAPIQPLQSGEVNTVGVNEDISGGYWSVSTLSKSLEV